MVTLSTKRVFGQDIKYYSANGRKNFALALVFLLLIE
jgi:hypothetical protein